MEKANIIIVEDESIVAMDIKYRLELMGYSVVATVSSGEEAVNKIMELTPDLVLMDVVLKGKMDGIAVAEAIRQFFNVPVIYLTAYGDDKTLERAKITEPYGYILKPFDGRELYTTIEMALYKSKMQKELKSSEEKYRLLVNTLPNVVFKGYADWTVDFFDDKITAVTGYVKADFDSRRLKWSDIIAEEDLETAKRIFAHSLKTFRSYIREYRIKTKDGSMLWIQEASQIVCDKKGEINFISGAFLDITKRKKEEEALNKISECFLTFGSDAGENTGKIVETAGNILGGASAFYCRVKGAFPSFVYQWNIPVGFNAVSELGKYFCRLFLDKNLNTPVVFHDFADTYAQEFPDSKRFNINTFLGCSVLVNKKIVGILAVLYNKNQNLSLNDLEVFSILAQAVSIEEERSFVQEQLIQSSKMAGIGILASGVAHEFNNLIAIMRAKSELALLEPSERNSNDALKSVMVSTERAQKITQSLLNFSRRVKPAYELSNLAVVMNETLQLLERELEKQRITVVRNFQEIPDMEIDVGQIQQAFLNLLVNAKEAMRKGGVLTIELFLKGEDAIIIIKDTGTGIKQEFISRIFEPFFTTKDSLVENARRGIGLGLSVSLGIIENHGGKVNVDSNDTGTCFTIKLPKDKSKHKKEK
ncbi:MAG: response regulator [Candidatus Omnitrophota bacterium]|jgi:PAS domain S-box-containing protein